MTMAKYPSPPVFIGTTLAVYAAEFALLERLIDTKVRLLTWIFLIYGFMPTVLAGWCHAAQLRSGARARDWIAWFWSLPLPLLWVLTMFAAMSNLPFLIFAVLNTALQIWFMHGRKEPGRVILAQALQAPWLIGSVFLFVLMVEHFRL